jgi:hypothetical protein
MTESLMDANVMVSSNWRAPKNRIEKNVAFSE